jgi:hypothetical protein
LKAPNPSRKGIRRSGLHLLALLLLVITCLRPALSLAAISPLNQPEKETRITLFDIALFYAGLIGVIIGAATGWVSLFLVPDKSPEDLPSDDEKKKTRE